MHGGISAVTAPYKIWTLPCLRATDSSLLSEIHNISACAIYVGKKVYGFKMKAPKMNVEKKMIRTDIPGHSAMLTGTLPYNTSAAGMSNAQADDQRRLTVGRGIVLNGQITDCQHLAIEGSVTAETLSTQRLDILESGSFKGAAEVQDAVISGRFDGRLVVTGRLTLKATAHVTGDIEYGALEIEAGSRIEARIAVRPAPAVEPAAEKTVTAKTSAVTDAAGKPLEASNDEADTAVSEERPGTFRRAVGY